MQVLKSNKNVSKVQSTLSSPQKALSVYLWWQISRHVSWSWWRSKPDYDEVGHV